METLCVPTAHEDDPKEARELKKAAFRELEALPETSLFNPKAIYQWERTKHPLLKLWVDDRYAGLIRFLLEKMRGLHIINGVTWKTFRDIVLEILASTPANIIKHVILGSLPIQVLHFEDETLKDITDAAAEEEIHCASDEANRKKPAGKRKPYRKPLIYAHYLVGEDGFGLTGKELLDLADH